MSYAGTCLTKAEWQQALRAGSARAVDDVMARGQAQGPRADIDQIIDHLVEVSMNGQKEYAWWAAHQYAEILGRAGADIPQRLQAAMQSKQDEINSRRNHGHQDDGEHQADA